MTRSIYTKLVAIILILIVSLMTVVGAFLLAGIRNFFVASFYDRMREVFAGAEMAADLRAAADEAAAPELMAEILQANMGRLGVDAGSRNYYILDGETGEYLIGSDPEAGRRLAVTRNMLTAMAGQEGYAPASGGDGYMDVAIPLRGESGSYIIYIIDNTETASRLNRELSGILLEAICIGLLISVLMSLLLAKTMVTPIESLTSAA